MMDSVRGKYVPDPKAVVPFKRSGLGIMALFHPIIG